MEEPKQKKLSTKELAKSLGLLKTRSFFSSSKGKPKRVGQIFSYLTVIDFESTCWREKKMNYAPEIIEFPAVLLNTATGEVECEFQYYVQPSEHPRLSSFCTELTGISQSQVDNGIPVGTCLMLFCKWLQSLRQSKGIRFDCESAKENVPAGAKWCTVVTWSDWDLGTCLRNECRRKQLRHPPPLRSWIDLRAVYKSFYGRKPHGLSGALEDLGIHFSGRQHSGLDDARNTAKLTWKMIQDGCVMKVTKCLDGTVEKLQEVMERHRKLDSEGSGTEQPKCDTRQDTSGPSVVRETDANVSASKQPPSESGKENTKQMRVHNETSINTPCHSVIVTSDKSEPRTNENIQQEERQQIACKNISVQPHSRETPLSTTNEPTVNANILKRKLCTTVNIINPKMAIIQPLASVGCEGITVGLSVPHILPQTTLQNGYNGESGVLNALQIQRGHQVAPSARLAKKGLVQQTLKIPTAAGLKNSSDFFCKKKFQDMTQCQNERQEIPIEMNTESDGDLVSYKPANLGDTTSDLPSLVIPKPRCTDLPSRCNEVTTSVCRRPKTLLDESVPLDLPVAGVSTPVHSHNKTVEERVANKSNASNPEAFKTPGTVAVPRPTASAAPHTMARRTTPTNTSVNKKTTPFSCALSSSNGGKVTPPLCGCGRRARWRTAANPGPNQGRNFFTCPLNHGRPSFGNNSAKNGRSGCGYFQWETKADISPYTRTPRTMVKTPYSHTLLQRNRFIKPPVFVSPPEKKTIDISNKPN